MRWHTSNIKPNPERDDSHLVIKLKQTKYYEFVTYNKENHLFIGYVGITVRNYCLDEVEKWCYVEEDDCNTDEMLALTAIQDAVNHVQSLYDTLLTDGICCGEEYRDLIGLNELQIIKDKLTKRILYLDDQSSGNER